MKLWSPKRLLSHGVALVVGLGLGAVATHHFTAKGRVMRDLLARIPVSKAADLAYGWGTRADAKELLTLKLSSLGSADRLEAIDGDLVRFRLALLDNAPRAELQRLCAAAAFSCSSGSLDRLVEHFRKPRKVGFEP